MHRPCAALLPSSAAAGGAMAAGGRHFAQPGLSSLLARDRRLTSNGDPLELGVGAPSAVWRWGVASCVPDRHRSESRAPTPRLHRDLFLISCCSSAILLDDLMHRQRIPRKHPGGRNRHTRRHAAQPQCRPILVFHTWWSGGFAGPKDSAERLGQPIWFVRATKLGDGT